MELEDKYTIIERLNNGTYLAKSTKDDREVAIKEISFGSMNDKEKKKLIEEVNTLMEMKSGNIVKYESYIVSKSKMCIYIVTEYCSGGNLEEYLNLNRQQGTKVEEKAIWKIFSQVVAAVQQIHNDKKGVILHRDIRPTSIFLDKNKNVKLGNFNFLRRLAPQEQFAQTTLNNTYYRSPQQICEGKFTEKSDIWALGCLLYEMASLKQPFQSGSDFFTCKMIKQNNPDPIPSMYSKQLNRIIKWCLYKQPQKRPSITTLMGVPQINFRVRNRKIVENRKIFEEKEKKIGEREMRIRNMEAEIKKLEEQVLFSHDEFEKENIGMLMNSEFQRRDDCI